MNLGSLEYFLTNKTQNMDLNALLSEKFETIFLPRLGAAYLSTYYFPIPICEYPRIFAYVVSVLLPNWFGMVVEIYKKMKLIVLYKYDKTNQFVRKNFYKNSMLLALNWM